MQTQHLRISAADALGWGMELDADSVLEVSTTTTSGSEEDCVRPSEGEAYGEAGRSDGEERLCEACDGAEAMMSKAGERILKQVLLHCGCAA
jgi:hypothetical protein